MTPTTEAERALLAELGESPRWPAATAAPPRPEFVPSWTDDHLTLFGGDCREVLASMEPESVHCVVTSPPYWGLRDYGPATWDGGDAACNHSTVALGRATPPDSGLTGGKATIDAGTVTRGDCGRCGAARIDAQIGLEPTPEAYVESMVAVFREVWRVLRDDGTLWLNLGDSYISGQGGRQTAAGQLRGTIRRDRPTPHARPELDNAPSGWAERAVTPRTYAAAGNSYGWKPKDLAGIPWRVAFALQADGWYLRSDIIWAKNNPMPESVTDRPTKSHEYMFLLAKSPRYYFDAEAVREADSGQDHRRAIAGPHTGIRTIEGRNGSGRNIRSVWTIATEPYKGAHFATFPRKLVEPCVKAGTSERGVCPKCGAPWERETGEPVAADGRGSGNTGRRVEGNGRLNTHMGSAFEWHPTTTPTTGWHPSCAHDAEPVPATVLDPFAGSGTTLLVAQSLGRRGVGIDLSPEYLQQALARNAQTPLGLVG